MNLLNLAGDILAINESLQNSAAKAINQHITARNWLIGYCIVNYEQNGEDRAQYGEHVLQNLAENLNSDGLSYRNLRLYRQFYIAYPELYTPVSQFLLQEKQIWQPAVAKSTEDLALSSERVFNLLPFTHLTYLMAIEDPVERAFYEIQAIKGTWSKRELKRQIDSNLFIRTGLSKDKDAVIALANDSARKTDIKDIVNSPYTFEFLGLLPAYMPIV